MALRFPPQSKSSRLFGRFMERIQPIVFLCVHRVSAVFSAVATASFRRFVCLALLTLAAAGCSPHSAAPASALAPSVIRAERRAYDGAPPVIPHRPFAAACLTCHGVGAPAVPGQAFAPPSPHGQTPGMGAGTLCVQCHVFRQTRDIAVVNSFIGERSVVRRFARSQTGAPPPVPHALFLREDCLACHVGPTARPEIRCSHPERVNCVQCHLPATRTTPRMY